MGPYDWLRSFLWYNPKKLTIWALFTYIKVSDVIDNADEIIQVDRGSERELSYAFLVYFLSTFPKTRIKNFVPSRAEDFIDISKRFRNEKLKMKNCGYTFEMWKKYVLHIASVLANLEIYFGGWGIFSVFFSILKESRPLDVNILFFSVSVLMVYLGAAGWKKFWIRKRYLQIFNCICFFVFVLLSFFVLILLEMFLISFPVVILPNLVLFRDSLNFLRGDTRE